MTRNLLKDEWKDLDSDELMLLLYERIGRPGQYDDASGSPNKFYLPFARSACRVAPTFRKKSIVAVEPGEAFDAAEWMKINKEIEESVLAGPLKKGREYSFSSFRVTGSWRGDRSVVQILPPPHYAPRAPYEMADHPFIFEFPIRVTDCWPVTNHRRMREHRKLTLLLNILLKGHTSFQSNRLAHFWASVPREGHHHESQWLQQFFFAELGDPIIDELSPPASEELEVVDLEEYYEKGGHDGKDLRVRANLDQSICCYIPISAGSRAKFDRATFWLELASRQWDTSVSTSFAALVSAIESLTERGSIHQFKCPTCGEPAQHEEPGATRRFKDFFDTYAPGAALENRRNDMYSIRSGILHGSDLMQLDQDLAFGWEPP